jgi:hypothetical protein
VRSCREEAREGKGGSFFVWSGARNTNSCEERFDDGGSLGRDAMWLSWPIAFPVIALGRGWGAAFMNRGDLPGPGRARKEKEGLAMAARS